jgi:hypothetical protein
MIDAGVDEPAVEQLERFHQVLRNSGTAELSCSESFIAPAEHVSIFAQCRTPTRRPWTPYSLWAGNVQLRAEASTRRISPKVPTLACSNVIIAQREARNVQILFQLSMTSG